MLESDILFEVLSKLGPKIRTTKDYWQMITDKKHPGVSGLVDQVKKTIKTPIQIRQSRSDPSVYLYYRDHGEYHL